MRVVFAGGGTGGHVYPALAVADRLAELDPRFEALFIGTRSGLESKIVPENGYRIEFISSRGVRGKGITGKIINMASLGMGVFQSSLLLRRFDPDLVFGSGGYASAAVVFAAWLQRRRIVLQEQNSVPGMANRFLSPCADRIYLGFEKAASYLKKKRGVVFTGNPIRKSINESAGDPASVFGLNGDLPVLLVFGGSQGASTLNKAAVEYLLANEGIQGIIQTGKRDFDEVKERLEPAGNRVHVSEYISRISDAYGAADIALARSGALSVSELIAVRLPAVLVPYPWSVDDHQLYNASAVVEKGGAVMIPDSELDGKSLDVAISGILQTGGRIEKMKEVLGGISRIDSTGFIAGDIIEMIGLPGRHSEGENREEGK
ncbi:MAG: undecaprenyldiphospho-muramoylpentapeptide beta-N-acetylglucosaminyltransferase [Candidatus Krumholzibacteriota bacterium]|nr:undecaprenyldiphospho-muramoylpentapeptide beta-N-acetylglucosaminyltransferase [Candidatus Krumholzibacteriota bacterium]